MVNQLGEDALGIALPDAGMDDAANDTAFADEPDVVEVGNVPDRGDYLGTTFDDRDLVRTQS